VDTKVTYMNMCSWVCGNFDFGHSGPWSLVNMFSADLCMPCGGLKWFMARVRVSIMVWITVRVSVSYFSHAI